MDYLIGFVVGVIVAGMIGRAHFLKVQTALRDTEDRLRLVVAEAAAKVKKVTRKSKAL